MTQRSSFTPARKATSRVLFRALRQLKPALVAWLCLPAIAAAAQTPVALETRLNAPEFDYYAERRAVGEAAFQKELDAMGSAIARRHGAKSVDDVCVTPQEHVVLDGYHSASRAASTADWIKDRQAASAQMNRKIKHVDDILLGAETKNPREQGASAMAAAALNEPNPILRDLYQRGARDQLVRAMLFEHIDMGNSDPALSQNANLSFITHLANYSCNIDLGNRLWLADQMKSNGWFDNERFGRRADGVAWLIVQHADEDVGFQADVLKTLEKLVPEGKTNKRNYAYLYDRVAINQGRPQRYGTQGRCQADGHWQVSPLEAPEELDARRAAMGLGDMTSYAKEVARNCG